MGGECSQVAAFRGPLCHALRDPGCEPHGDGVEYLDDGLLVVLDGRVMMMGDAPELLASLPAGTCVHDCRDKLIVPGFVDTHTHYPQTDIIASYGTGLLDWLERYAFPVEQQFAQIEHAREVAAFFLDELLRNGSTTAMVFGTVHPQSVDALFEAAESKNMCVVAGKVMMDRHCPEALRDPPERGYEESKALIERWHGRGRLAYAVTPRFAPTSSEAQLEEAGRLLEEHPGVYLHTHVAENRDEVELVAELFPWSRSYLDVYDRFGLLGPRSVFAHCIYLDATDRGRMSTQGAAMSFCPTSNLFLGSGLFDVEAARVLESRVGIGTDVGGGTSFSMLRTLSEAYKVARLNQQTITPFRALYLATLGGARSLSMDHEIGNFETGKAADFVLLDPYCTPLMSRRLERAEDVAERLFAMIMLGDDRTVAETYVMGEAAYRRG